MPKRLQFYENERADAVKVKPRTICVITERPSYNHLVSSMVRNLKGVAKRSWFTPHFYKCLPLVVGNQQGFVVLSERSLVVRWNGGNSAHDVTIVQDTAPQEPAQNVRSHFGNGIVTVDLPWIYRTEPGVSLYVTQPPNYFVDGIGWMTAVIDTDRLRTDFTFNLKILRKGVDISIPSGTPIGFFMPVRREDVGSFDIEVAAEGSVVDNERQCNEDFQLLRHKILKGGLGFHYLFGVDHYGHRYD